jgi:hypothetical protein
MKKIKLILVAFALVLLCGACHMNDKCPAYADNSVVEENNV